MLPTTAGDRAPGATATAQYCAKLQEWMWLYYCGHARWQSWHCARAPPDLPPWSSHARLPAAPASQTERDGNPSQAGQEYDVASPLQRLLAEAVDFSILFCVKATVVLWLMRLWGMKDMAKFIGQFIVEEMDESASMEELRRMVAVALGYRACVCVYEIVCIWAAAGATPGKFLLGLQVVRCDTTTRVRPNRVLVVPASNVSLSAAAVRALNKNLSIAFLFPVFITVLFFQHNRTVYDIVAGTIVVQRRRAR